MIDCTFPTHSTMVSIGKISTFSVLCWEGFIYCNLFQVPRGGGQINSYKGKRSRNDYSKQTLSSGTRNRRQFLFISSRKVHSFPKVFFTFQPISHSVSFQLRRTAALEFGFTQRLEKSIHIIQTIKSFKREGKFLSNEQNNFIYVSNIEGWSLKRKITIIFN